MWTYFNIAEAHQWLRLGEVERAWQITEWFWENQASPGLWTWWEGNREENSFGLWQHARGWARPDCVTPHYWTAAEMLALQIEMLVSVNRSGQKPVLIIGAGVRTDWLDHPMKVAGISTPIGIIDWQWDNAEQELIISVHGSGSQSTVEPVEIRPGAAFARAKFRVQL